MASRPYHVIILRCKRRIMILMQLPCTDQRVHFRLLANYMALPFKSKINHKDTKNRKFFLEISVRSVPLW